MDSKYLVTVEFRYNDIFDEEITCKSKILTIGVFNCFNEACLNGNNFLEIMENKFELHEFPDGRKAAKERFNKRKSLITNLAYLKTSFQFFIKITELKYEEIEKTIDNVLDSVERYKNFKNTEID